MTHLKKLLSGNSLLAIALFVLGLFFIFITPPMQVPDESSHFFRTWQVSEGGFNPKAVDRRLGGEIPNAVQKFCDGYFWMVWCPKGEECNKPKERFDEAYAIHLDKKEASFIDFNNTAIYSFIAYLPAALGIKIAQIFSDRVMIMFLMARFFNLLFWSGLLFFTLRGSAPGNRILLFLALLPGSVFINSSLSADVFSNTACFVFIALVLSIRSADQKIKLRNQIALVIFALLIASAKYIYLATIMSVFLIPSERFNSVKHKIVFITVLFVAGFLALFYWTNSAGNLYISYDAYHPDYRDHVALVPQVNPTEQLSWLKQNPSDFLQVLWHSIDKAWPTFLRQYIGVFGWLTIKLPETLIFLLIFNLLLSAITEPISFSLKERFVLFATFVAILVLVVTSQFLIWVPVGGNLIQNIQGRYLIPAVPFLVLSLAGLISAPNWIRKTSAVISLTSALFSLYLLYFYYH